MAADLITLAEGALLTQFLTPTAKHYGELALKRIQQLGERAKAMLAGAGREPQGIEEKLLVPLVQAASLESDPTLAEKWAVLLANAADPTQQAQVKPSFIEILKQLTLVDALIFDAVAKVSSLQPAITEEVNAFVAIGLIKDATDSIPGRTFAIAIDTLLQLRLCVTVPRLADFNSTSITMANDKDLLPINNYISLTHLGLAFLAAVTPPIK